MEREYSGRRQAIGHLDAIARVIGFAFCVLFALLITLLVGNLLFYLFFKEPYQLSVLKKYKKSKGTENTTAAEGEISIFDFPPIPPTSWRWRLPEVHQGDPYEDFLQAQLDFRAYQREYVTAKLLKSFPEDHQLAAPKYLMYAATRPDRPITMEAELLLNGHDLRDAASLLLVQSEEAEQKLAALAPTLDETTENEDLAATREELMVEAERLLRAYYSCGLYLASREYRLHLKLTGVEMMVEGIDHLSAFYEHRLDLLSETDEGVSSYQEKISELAALKPQLEHILDRGRQWENWQDDDRHLEIWIHAFETARSPAVQLEAASHLNRVARRWWRYGESARAMRAIRHRASHHYNLPMRDVLLNLLLVIESNEPAPRIFRDHPRAQAHRPWLGKLDYLI